MAIVTTLSTVAIGLTEGAGLSLMIPILALAGVDGGTSQTEIEKTIAWAFELVGLPLSLVALLGLFLFVGLMYIACQTIQKLLIVQARERLNFALRVMLFDAAGRASWARMVEQRSSHVVNAITTETTRIISVVGYGITVVGLFTILSIYILGALWISWQFTTVILGIGLATSLMLAPLYKLSLRLGTQTFKTSNRLQEVLSEHMTAGRVIRALDLQPDSVRLFGEAAREVMTISVRNQSNTPLVNAWVEPVALLAVVSIIYIGLRVINLAAGELVAMLVIFYRIAPRVVMAQERTQRLFAMMPSFEHLSEMARSLTASTEVPGVQPFTGLADRIELDHVTVSFEGREILSDLSLVIPARSTIALVGPSGGGKSTVLDLILGLRLAESGAVRYDRVNIADINLKSLRRRLGVVLQDGAYFHDTIRNNLLFMNSNASEPQIWNALDRANASDFIRQMPQGLDTVIGDRGVRLSSGQRQRIGLAQALLRDPEILILDEPTSALDKASEEAVRETLRRLQGEVTIVLVSHRESLTLDVDAVYHIEHGKAVRVDGATAPA